MTAANDRAVTARRNALLLAGGLAVVCLLLLRCGAGDEPAARPRRTASTVVPTRSDPGPAPVVGAPGGPSTTTEEAAPDGPPPAGAADDAARVTVGFLRAWLLRADIDTRRGELAKWATTDYAGMTAFADPARLPPGDTVTVEAVDLRGDLAATVTAAVDGIKVRVDLTRTGRGYLAESHAPI